MRCTRSHWLICLLSAQVLLLAFAAATRLTASPDVPTAAQNQAAKADDDKKLQRYKAALRQATDRADRELLASVRKDIGSYVLGGWELAKHPPNALTSIAETPVRPDDPKRLIIEAEKYDRGNADRDFEIYGKGIGIIRTTRLPTFAEWDIEVPNAGTYQIEMRYAAQESRPVRLLLNGAVIRADCASKVTGSWQPEGQRWEAQGIYAFKAGKNTLRIERDASIPHFDKLLIAPMSLTKTGPDGKPYRTPEQIAAAQGLNAELLNGVASVLRGMSDNPLLKRLTETSDLLPEDFKALADSLTQKLNNTGEEAANPLLTALDNKKILPAHPERFYSEPAKKAIRAAKDALKTLMSNAPKTPRRG